MKNEVLSLSEKGQSDEVYIEESFEWYSKIHLSTEKKKELLCLLLGVLDYQTNHFPKKYHLLWYLPQDMFESVVLSFDSLAEVKAFFLAKQEDGNDDFKIEYNKDTQFDNYLNVSEEQYKVLKIKGHFVKGLSERNEDMPILIYTTKKLNDLIRNELMSVAREKLISQAK